MIIKTPSRLHMTLIDMNGSYGRIDGGIGLTINQPNFILKGEPSEKGLTIEFNDELSKDVEPDCISKISKSADLIFKHYDIEEGFYFEVEKAYLNHSGLGSGTQMALATAKLLTESFGIEEETYRLSSIVGRGGTSGIGTFAFDNGGFIVDGGHSKKEKDTFLPSSASDAKPPKLIARYDFPDEWNIMIAVPNIKSSIAGQREIDIFSEFCPVPQDEVEQISHLILMNMIPFLLEKDIKAFGKCVDELQIRGFNKKEIAILPPEFKAFMNKVREFGAYGVGISSFGPTIYSIYDDDNKDIVDATKEYLGPDQMVLSTKAQNHGYELIK